MRSVSRNRCRTTAGTDKSGAAGHKIVDPLNRIDLLSQIS
jgi:hypothetical protein